MKRLNWMVLVGWLVVVVLIGLLVPSSERLSYVLIVAAGYLVPTVAGRISHRRRRAEACAAVNGGVRWAASATLWAVRGPVSSGPDERKRVVIERGFATLDASGMSYSPSARRKREGSRAQRWELATIVSGTQRLERGGGGVSRRRLTLDGESGSIDLTFTAESSPLPDVLEKIAYFA